MNARLLLRRTIFIAALIAGSAVSLPLAAATEKGGDRRPDPYRALRLPRDRAERLRDLQSRVDRENRQLKERREERREELEKLYRSYNYNANRCEQLRREIRDLQSQILELHHRFQVELRVVLTESEFERLQRELREARRRRDDD